MGNSIDRAQLQPPRDDAEQRWRDGVGRILGDLRARVPSRHAAAFRVARCSDTWMRHDIVPSGEEIASWPKRGLADIGGGRVDPTMPPADAVNRFVRVFHDGAPTKPAPARSRLHLAVGVRSEVRLLVYDRDRFVCWLGLARGAWEGRHRRDDLNELEARRPFVVRRLIALDRALRAARDELPTPSVLLDRHGGVEAASAAGGPWLTERRREELRAFVAEVSDHGAPPERLVGGFCVHLRELVRADGRSLHLAEAERASRPRLHPASRLTARQRQVSELAARGEQIPEIAARLEISEWTVREHLKQAYRRLGVSSRVELVRRLTPEDQPG